MNAMQRMSNSRDRDHTIALAVFSAMIIGLGVPLGSCGGSQRSYAPEAVSTAAPYDARDEIERLWQDIERMRSGDQADDVLATRNDPVEAVEPAATDDYDDDEEDGDRATAQAGMDDRTSEPRAEPRSQPRRPPVTSEVRLVCPDGRNPPFATCGDSCRIAQSICNNAESICRLASELAGDGWASGKCHDARDACSEATKTCCACSNQ